MMKYKQTLHKNDTQKGVIFMCFQIKQKSPNINIWTESNHGRGGENRTPIKSFGDSYATIIPRP